MGVLAVYGVQNASTYIYYGLHNLQHRGQEGGGIATFDENGKSYRHRGQGLLSEIFTNGEIGELKGSMYNQKNKKCSNRKSKCVI